MDENKTYSAEDLLRYAHGQMPMAERHALEKAALEDLFLAEALDGYMEQGDGIMGNKSVEKSPNDISQLEELRKIIADKAADKKKEKQIPVVSILRNKWLQRLVAAMFILGAAWWLYSISNKSKEAIVGNNKQIAQVQPPIIIDSVLPTAKPKNIQISKPTVVANLPEQEQPKVSADKNFQENKTSSSTIKNHVVVSTEKPAPEKAPIIIMADTVASPSKDMALNEVTTSNSNAYKNENKLQSVVAGLSVQRKSEAELHNVIVAKKPSFVFQGRVLDANLTPLPFSNVTVPGENFGTYSDGEGYFNFVSSDSVLPVRAKSLGFETKNYNMRANEKENRIVLNEDKNLDKSLTFLRSEKQKNSAEFKPTIVKVDTISSTVEPFVGWHNYDLYLANNNRISDLQFYSNRSVLLSFEVSQDGGIKNITVDKSQGKDLDAEAIRLLKEGPRWKVKNGKKGRVEVKF